MYDFFLHSSKQNTKKKQSFCQETLSYWRIDGDKKDNNTCIEKDSHLNFKLNFKNLWTAIKYFQMKRTLRGSIPPEIETFLFGFGSTFPSHLLDDPVALRRENILLLYQYCNVDTPSHGSDSLKSCLCILLKRYLSFMNNRFLL